LCRYVTDDQGLGKTVSTLAIILSAPPPDDRLDPHPRWGSAG
jgi:SNF2 family DNA or RNA helicase